jgi:hypothetical protein
MNRTHHCEDKECGRAAPKARCIVKLHFAFCLAPVVDKDVESKTYGKVVIHGERFAVIPPTGCAEHPYRAEYNLDLKDARNDRANYEIRWKKIFEDFKAEHEATLKREAEQMRVMEKIGMTGHQRQTMLARQDNMEYQQRRHLELANRAAIILNNKEDEAGGLSENEALQPSSAADPGTAVAVARPPPDPKWGIQEELAQIIGSVTSEDLRSVLRPLWLHDELFVRVDNRRAKTGERQESSVVIYGSPRGIKLPAPTFMWLLGELFPDVDEDSVEVVEAAVPQAVVGLPEDAGVTRVAGGTVVSRMRRKENKLVKKQRAAESRALARTMADEMETQEAEEKELEQPWTTGKSRAKKGLGRTRLTRFA